MSSAPHKIYALYKTVNPHHPSSGYESLIALSSDKDFIDLIYESAPELHFQPGKAIPVIILEIREFNNHHYDKWALDIIRDKK